MLKTSIKEYIYQVLDKLSEKYQTEIKNTKLETAVKNKINKLTANRDKKS